jgi:serine-type D-Ala-D-Ala carboxypeptidase/endopeptidase
VKLRDFLIVGLSLSRAVAQTIAPDAEIRKLLVERIDTRKQAVGIVVGVIDSNGRRIVSYGSFAQADPRPPISNTVSPRSRKCSPRCC